MYLYGILYFQKNALLLISIKQFEIKNTIVYFEDLKMDAATLFLIVQ